LKKSLSTKTSFILSFLILLLLCLWDREMKFLMMWAFHLAPILLIGVPLWYFGQRRVQWNGYDFLIIIVPFLAYLGGAFVLPANESFGVLVMLVWLGCFLPVVPLIRVIVGQTAWASKLSVVLLVLSCMVAVLLYWIAPVGE
jgi:hypothetical protein